MPVSGQVTTLRCYVLLCPLMTGPLFWDGMSPTTEWTHPGPQWRGLWASDLGAAPGILTFLDTHTSWDLWQGAYRTKRPCLPELYPDNGADRGSHVGSTEGRDCRKIQGNSYETSKGRAGQWRPESFRNQMSANPCIKQNVWWENLSRISSSVL